MKKNKINFISGETYTLSELFSEDRKIIIPDLQRDYCWGDSVPKKGRKELVSGFIKTLIEQFNSKDKFGILNLGLIYGYEAPANHIQLCDGQQRITTLYLLIGMLNKKEGNNEFKKYLISDYEYQDDDKEPFLQYSIRDTSLYFLSDLVCNFFITDDGNNNYVESCNEIKGSSWYFNEYNHDPSIQSMISAINIIDNILSDKTKEWCHEFGNFLTTDLSFMYYDMEDRKNGEETFVVINTTGEPLSKTQNLKPLVIMEPLNKNYHRIDEKGNIHSLAEDWEEIETWFWNNRCNDNDTADAGFNEFLRWVTMLNSHEDELRKILSEGTYTFPTSKISFVEIYSYWKSVKFLFESWDNKTCKGFSKSFLSPAINHELNENKAINQIDCFKLLPMIAYCKKWSIKDSNDRNTVRFYQFLLNLTRIGNVSRTVNSLVKDVILIANKYRDLIELCDDGNLKEISTTILSNEELKKLSIFKEEPSQRNEIEDAFWEAQSPEKKHCHYIWAGQIMPLIEWASTEGKFNLKKFKEYLSCFDSVFKDDGEAYIDPVRRALLTRGLSKYPQIFRGSVNYSFGWEWNDWDVLINENKEQFKSFFDDIIGGKTFEQMIRNYPQSNEWAEFVHKDYLLNYCEHKNIRWDVKEGWLLIKKERLTSYISVKNIHLSQYLKEKSKKTEWKVWIWDGDRTVVENESKDIVFYIWYSDSKWFIQFFKRRTEVKKNLEPFIDSTWTFNGDRYEKCINYLDGELPYTYPNILGELETIITKIRDAGYSK